MSVLEKSTLDLGPTATYARREAEWVPAADPGSGILVLTLWKGRRAGSKSERDAYDVQEEDAVGVMGRSFLLLNLTDESQEDVYRCVVGPESFCTCKAGLCRVPTGCKHTAAMSALIGEGHL